MCHPRGLKQFVLCYIYVYEICWTKGIFYLSYFSGCAEAFSMTIYLDFVSLFVVCSCTKHKYAVVIGKIWSIFKCCVKDPLC
jgi:hypothetical protein